MIALFVPKTKEVLLLKFGIFMGTRFRIQWLRHSHSPPGLLHFWEVQKLHVFVTSFFHLVPFCSILFHLDGVDPCCMLQILVMEREIYKFYDDFLEVRGVRSSWRFVKFLCLRHPSEVLLSLEFSLVCSSFAIHQGHKTCKADAKLSCSLCSLCYAYMLFESKNLHHIGKIFWRYRLCVGVGTVMRCP